MPFLTRSSVKRKRPDDERSVADDLTNRRNESKQVPAVTTTETAELRQTAAATSTSPKEANADEATAKQLKCLERELKEKEDILRRLKLVEHYKSRVSSRLTIQTSLHFLMLIVCLRRIQKDIAELDALISKWLSVSQRALTELHAQYVKQNTFEKTMSMLEFMESMKVNAKRKAKQLVNEK